MPSRGGKRGGRLPPQVSGRKPGPRDLPASVIRPAEPRSTKEPGFRSHAVAKKPSPFFSFRLSLQPWLPKGTLKWAFCCWEGQASSAERGDPGPSGEEGGGGSRSELLTKTWVLVERKGAIALWAHGQTPCDSLLPLPLTPFWELAFRELLDSRHPRTCSHGGKGDL